MPQGEIVRFFFESALTKRNYYIVKKNDGFIFHVPISLDLSGVSFERENTNKVLELC